jgi:arginine/lysine/histidine/glutamine transport system substrate-binding/permease protein
MMNQFARRQFLQKFALGVTSAVVFAACTTAPDAPEADDAASAEGGSDSVETLVVATEPAFPPFEFQNDDGSYDGFDIDLMNAIADAAGFEVQYESLPFDGIIPALQAGTVDAAISAMTITEARLETVDFSSPYFKAGLAIAVEEDNTEITSLESLEGKTIAVQIGTTGAEKANSIEGATVSTFDSAPLALQELANGNADAVINDAPVTLDAIASGNIDGITVIGELLTEEFYGIATPQGADSLELINSGLATIIENGTYADIYSKWFGAEAPELPTEVTF